MPGDELPSIREATHRYKTTASTISRAYQHLAEATMIDAGDRRRSRVYNSPFVRTLLPAMIHLWRREQGLLTAEGNPDHVGGPGRLRALRVQAAHNSSVRGHPRQRHKWQPHGIGREVDFPHRRLPMTAGPAGRHARQSPGSGNTAALAKARLLPVQRPRPGGK